MNRFALIVALSMVFGFVSCKKDGDTKPSCDNSLVTISAKARYGADPLVLFQNYDYPQGFKVKFSRADFIIKGMQFSGPSGKLAYPDSVFVLKFESTDVASAENGVQLKFDKCEGNYNSLSLGIGLDSLTNASTPSDFPSSHALANAFYYWDAWKSYIYLKIEGKYDKDGDGNFEGNFVYHIGTDKLYRIINLPVNINAETGKSNSIVLNFDIKTILANGSDFIDIISHPSSHNPGDIQIATKIADNLQPALSTN